MKKFSMLSTLQHKIQFFLARVFDLTSLGSHAQLAEQLLTSEDTDVHSISPADRRDQKMFSWMQMAWSFGGAGAFAAGRYLISEVTVIGFVIAAMTGGLAGELWRQSRNRRKIVAVLRKQEFHLPLVMERIVMGVSAGLDVLPAIQAAADGENDEVSILLRKVITACERGLAVESALREVALQGNSLAVKHALIHLGLTYREGGNLIEPLRELSDATQLNYQETVEEEISRLPVKAVAPLMCTFAGLLICFLTVPVLQVGSFTAKVAQGASNEIR